MSYMKDPGYLQRFAFSNSQLQVMRTFLRYETALVRDTDPDFGCHASDGCIGGRTRLGEYVHHQPSDKLDFDGDGYRDIAWWTPPSPNNTSTWEILESTKGYDPAQKIVVTGFGDLGDIPVPADYNGDGLTDIAVYRPGGDPFSQVDQSYWYICNNLDCNQQMAPVPFGLREDVPLPGLDFDGNPSTGEVAVFRPSEGRWVWTQVYPNLWANYTSKYVGASGSVPLPGLYDLDNATDLVAYLPQYALFEMLLSGDGWTQAAMQQFPNDCVATDYVGASNSARAGCVPVRGMIHHIYSYTTPPPFQLNIFVPRLALSVWDPNAATWITNWNPTAGPSEPTSCVLGTSGETPVGGLGSPWSNQWVEGRSRYTTLLGQVWEGGGVFRFRDAPCGNAWNQAAPVVSPETMVFSVRDMTGDRKPEMWVVDPNTMQARILRSEDDYTVEASFSPVTVGMNQWSIIL